MVQVSVEGELTQADRKSGSRGNWPAQRGPCR